MDSNSKAERNASILILSYFSKSKASKNLLAEILKAVKKQRLLNALYPGLEFGALESSHVTFLGAQEKGNA